MENESFLSMRDFNLDKEQMMLLDVFYLSLKQQVSMGGSYYEIESFVVKEYCKKFEMDFIESLKVCKRLANEKNRLSNDK